MADVEQVPAVPAEDAAEDTAPAAEVHDCAGDSCGHAEEES